MEIDWKCFEEKNKTGLLGQYPILIELPIFYFALFCKNLYFIFNLSVSILSKFFVLLILSLEKNYA